MARPARADTPQLLVVVSGPAGVGKDTVMKRLLEDEAFVRPITMTTRPPRPGEVHGVHYLFVSRERFDEAIANGELLEWAEVHGKGDRYGTPRAEVQRALDSGRDVLLQVDVQGAEALRERLRGTLQLFIAPDSLEQLRGHLRARKTAPEEIERRLATARRELEAQARFDHVVVNHEGDLDGTVAAVLALFEEERARPGRAHVGIVDPPPQGD